MSANLKKRIWESHPLLPRIKKLKLVKYLPIAFDRLVVISGLLGLPLPDFYSEKFSTIDDDDLVVCDQSNTELCRMYVGNKVDRVCTLTLPSGRQISEHEYHLLRGETPLPTGVITGCKCVECHLCLVSEKAEQIDRISEAFVDRPVRIHVPKEDKINSLSKEAQERLPNEYRVTQAPRLTIVKITRPSNET
jgi:hypothetical protein